MKGFWIVILVLVSISCSTKNNPSESENLKEEFPKVNLENFDTIKFENEFQFIVLKELTASRKESERSVIGYSHLSKEKHFYIEKRLISNCSESLKARKISPKDLLKSFAEEDLKDFKGVLKSSTSSKFLKSEVNGLACYRTNYEGDSYGFPKTKSFSFRYFKGEKYFYTLVCWTTKELNSKFEKEALAMGLSFKEL